MHEIAPTVAFRGTQWGFWWCAWLSLYGTLRGRRGSLDVVHEIASTGLFCVTGTGGVSCHSMGLLAACVAIIVWHFAWQAWRFEGIICTR